MIDTKRSADSSTKPVKRTKITDFFKKVNTGEIKTESKESDGKEKIGTYSEKFTESTDKSATENTSNETSTVQASKITVSVNPKAPTVFATEESPDSFDNFALENNFDKDAWVALLTEEQRQLLDLEINHLHITWLTFLHQEITKPYFLQLKKFVISQQKSKTVFPPPHQIYSWSHYTPLPNLKCLVLGQDPYHNFNQAHGLAFSVLEPTKPPPSLKNIYKGITNDYPQFKAPDSTKGGGGNLTKWAKRGVLLLNTCLTVEAHKANSHSKHGWETFTQKVINVAIEFHEKKSGGFVVMAWGMPAQNTVNQFPRLQKSDKFYVLKTFHPSPFSAAKGFFTAGCFKKCNEWLLSHGRKDIDWSLVDGNCLT